MPRERHAENAVDGEGMTTATKASSSSLSCARSGDIVTLEYYDLRPENGFVPEPLFDLSGNNVALLLGSGNYLPGLHELIQGRNVGEIIKNVSIDAGWGDHRSDLVFRVSLDRIRTLGIDVSLMKIGSKIYLDGNIPVTVTSLENDMVSLDANHPLAGSSYSCSLKICKIESFSEEEQICHEDSQYQKATFALGCFWGAELAFMRIPGVVGTRVGYSQGITANPTYDDVCKGKTQHREVVQIIYDSEFVSYNALLQVAIDRRVETKPPLRHNLFNAMDEDSMQYQHGFIFHNDNQKQSAELIISNNDHLRIELFKASDFWLAEEFHQKYLYKGGQSARKGCKEKIRCFG